MDRHPPTRAATRTFAQHEDARDLRAEIVRVLDASPIDERALRNAVWTYVRLERMVGVAPGVVILALTDMVDHAKLATDDVRVEHTRRVILWCVEAYFGRLGDGALDASDRDVPAHGDVSAERDAPAGVAP